MIQAILALWLGDIWVWSVQETGYAFLLIGLVMAIAQGSLIGPIVKKLGEVNTFLLGVGSTLVAFVSFPLAEHLSLLIFALVLVSFGYSLFRPSLIVHTSILKLASRYLYL